MKIDYDKNEIYLAVETEDNCKTVEEKCHYGCYEGEIKGDMIHLLEDLNGDQIFSCVECDREIHQ